MTKLYDRWRRRLAGVLMALALAGAAGCAAGQQRGGAEAQARRASEGRPIEAELAAATFDTAWARVRDTYYDPALRGVDWDAVRAELYPRAAVARTYGELRGVLHEMLDRLGESHFGVIPGDIANTIEQVTGESANVTADADVGMELRLVDGQLVVFRVAADGPAAAAGVRAGWVVDAIGDRDAAAAAAMLRGLGEGERRDAELRLTMGFHALLNGPAGSTVTVRFRDGDDARVEHTLARRPVPGTIERIGFLPPMPAHLTHHIVEHGGARIGVIAFNVWMPSIADAFHAAVDALRATDGIVIDIRGNPGGVAAMIMGTAGHFLTEPVSLGVMRRREGELRFPVNPRVVDTQGRSVNPFGGPLAIVTDEMSASTSEIFAAGMRAVGRARVFGDRTAGQALPAILTRLPNGDALMHVVADLHAADGSRLEGAGVVPDMALPLRRDALLAGRDDALLGALGWIATSVARADGRVSEPAGTVADTAAATAAVTTRGAAGAGVADTAAAGMAAVSDTTAAASGAAAADTTALGTGAARAAEPEPPVELPSAVSLIERHVDAVGGRAAIRGWSGLRASGRVEIPGGDVAGSLHMLQGSGGRLFMRAAIPGFGDVLQGYDGVSGWSISPREGARLLTGAELAQLQEDHDLRAILRDSALITAVESVGRDAFDGEACQRVRVVWRSGRETFDCYSETTGLLIATIGLQPTPGAGDVQVITLLGEYRRFGDVQFPTRIRQQVLGTEQILRIEHIEPAEFTDGAFAPPAAIQTLLRRRG